MVVMVIIGLLAGLVGPRILEKVDSSKVQTAQVQIKMIESALQIMRLDIGTLPEGETALQWLTKRTRRHKRQSNLESPVGRSNSS